MATLITPNLASLIPAADLAAAVRLAFDTLVELLADKKASIRERRMVASAILRLARPLPAPDAARAPRGAGPAPRDAGPESSKVRVSAQAPPSMPRVPDDATLSVPQTPSPARTLLAALGVANRSPIQPRAA